MADRLSIYRGALALLGRGRLSSLTEVSPDRVVLDDAWQPAVDMLLSEGLWNWGIRTIEIQADTDVEPIMGWGYSFEKPADWIRTNAICRDALFGESYNNYHDEGNYWFSDVPVLYIRYLSSLDAYGWNIGRWTPMFAKALEAYLAFESGLTVNQDKGNRNDTFQIYQSRLKRAKILDAVNESVQHRPVGKLVRARFAYGTRMDDLR